jgi:hypothetical protein
MNTPQPSQEQPTRQSVRQPSLLPARPRYDYERNQWVPQCPYGDVCTGCDAAGRCTRVILTEDEYLDHLASLEDARSY